MFYIVYLYCLIDKHKFFLIVLLVSLVSLFAFQTEAFAMPPSESDNLNVISHYGVVGEDNRSLPNYGRSDPIEPDIYDNRCSHGKPLTECLNHKASIRPRLHRSGLDQDWFITHCRHGKLFNNCHMHKSSGRGGLTGVSGRGGVEVGGRILHELGVRGHSVYELAGHSSSAHTINSEPRELFAMDIEGSSWASKSDASFAKHTRGSVEFIKAHTELVAATVTYEAKYNIGAISKILSHFKPETSSDYVKKCAL